MENQIDKPDTPEEPKTRLPVWLRIALWTAIPILALILAFFFGPDLIAIGLKYDTTRPYSQRALLWLGPVAIRQILASDGTDWSGNPQQLAINMCKRAERGLTARFLLLAALRSPCYTGDQDMTLLHIACWADCPNLIEELLRRGADVDATAGGGCTPLLLTSNTTRTKDLVRLLLAHGANPNAKTDDGITSLHWSATVEIAELLIAHGADVNAKNVHGLTPLHCTGSKEIAELLISHGADVNAMARNGMTPLHHAASKDLAELLIARGADVNARDNGGQTPLKTAETYHWHEVANFLRSHGTTE